MKKYKHIQSKFKTAKRLLNFLKYRRHKKIRESIFNSRKKLISLRANYNRIKHKYFLKKEKLGFYNITGYFPKTPHNQISSNNYLSKIIEINQEKRGYQKNQIKLTKKKYKIHSYLSNVICKFPKKYVYHFFGKDILRKYYTMPFKLNISQFISKKILKSYYKTLSHKALLNLCQKASKGQGVNIGLDIYGFLISKEHTSKHNNVVNIIEKAERAKNFLLCLEKRLDSTLLRTLHFKPFTSLSSIRRSLSVAIKKQKLEINTIKQIKLTKYPKYQIKSPWTMFGAEYIRQLISHGHIFINNKKVQSPGTQVHPGDQIQIKGFIINFTNIQKHKNTLHEVNKIENPPININTKIFTKLKTQSENINKFLKINHKLTLLLRRFKNQNYLNHLDNLTALNELKKVELDLTENVISQEILYNYIKDLKIKRFTEAFYMTYRNLHLIERTSFLPILSNSTNYEIESNQFNWFHETSKIQEIQAVNNNRQLETTKDIDVEKHIQPVFETIGYNQSIYLLWPVISLLRLSSWGPNIKRAVIQSSTRVINNIAVRGSKNNWVENMDEQIKQGQEILIQQQKKKLQNLLKWKKLQTSTSEINILNSQRPQLTTWSGSTKLSIPFLIRSLLLRNPSWLHTQTRGVFNNSTKLTSIQQFQGTQKSFRSYASIVYGTRKCKWIRLQQGSGGLKGSFYNQIPNHIQFFQLELEFYQFVYRGVQGQF